MPLKSGKSQKTVSSNIRELHGGNTYARTEAKFGKDKANKQAVAIALDKARGRAFGGGLPGVGGMLTSGVSLAGPPAGLAPFAGAMTPQGGKSAPAGLSGLMQGFPQGVAGGFAAGGPVKAPRINGGIRHITKGPLISEVPGRTDAHKTHVPSGSYVIPADIVSGRGEGNTLAGLKSLQQLFKMGPYSSGKALSVKGKGQKFADGGAVPEEPEPVRVNLAGGELVIPPENIMETVNPDIKVAHEILDKWVLRERKKLRKTLAKLPGPAKD